MQSDCTPQIWMTLGEAAKYMRVRREAVEQAVRRGDIPAYRPSVARLIHYTDADAFVRNHPWEVTR